MEQRYDDVITSLRTSYDNGAEPRDRTVKEPWKLAERQGFLDRLRAAGCARLLEIGAGTGQDAAFFAANGLDGSFDGARQIALYSMIMKHPTPYEGPELS